MTRDPRRAAADRVGAADEATQRSPRAHGSRSRAFGAVLRRSMARRHVGAGRSQQSILSTLALVCTLASPALARSQTVVEAEGAVGLAAGGGGEYRDRERTTWRLGVGTRVARVSRSTFMVNFERERVFMGGDRIDICQFGSRGQCLDEYPQLVGWAGSAGVRLPLASRAMVGGRAGIGRYRSTDGASRRLPDDASGAGVVQADVAVRAWKRVWLLAAARRIWIADIREEPLTVGGVTIGVRVGLGSP